MVCDGNTTIHCNAYDAVHPAFKMATIIVLVITSIMSVTGNCLILIVMFKFRHFQSSTSKLLASLATADLLVGAVMIPNYLLMLLGYINEAACLFRKFLFLFTSSASLLSLAAVSFDKMMAISYPFLYARHASSRFFLFVTIFIWTYTSLLSSISFYPFENWNVILPTCDSGVPRVVYLVVTPTCFYLPGIIIVGVYIKIFLVARTNRIKVQMKSEPSVIITDSHSDDFNEKSNHLKIPVHDRVRTVSTISSISTTVTSATKKIKKSVKSDLRAARTVGILVGIFLICWCPVACLYVYLNSTGVGITSNLELTYWHEVFLAFSFLNSAVNPILYTALTVDLRTQVRKTITSCCCWSRKFTT